MNLLEIAGISKRFGGVQALNRVSLEVREGAVVGLIGPNGAGKTTLFNIITGITPPDAGTIRFAGRPIHKLPPHHIAQLGIARTFQNIHLFKGLSAADNVKTALHTQARYGVWAALLRTPGVRRAERELTERARELLDLVGLSVYRDEQADSLPYGHQRRLEIARALALRPRLLLLDEPAAGMNPEESRVLTELIREIVRRFHITVLLIEHHMDVVMGLSERVIVLDFGEKIAEGTPAEVQRNPRVIEAYLGQEAAAC